jgi:uncharacterized Zn finger protein
MDIVELDEATVRDRCPDGVFERGQSYREEDRIRRVDRFGAVITAEVWGSNPYDVTVELGSESLDATCSCPDNRGGDCKHIVAVLLDVIADPPADQRERVVAALEDVPPEELHAFVHNALARRPELREQFLAQFEASERDRQSPRTS